MASRMRSLSDREVEKPQCTSTAQSQRAHAELVAKLDGIVGVTVAALRHASSRFEQCEVNAGVVRGNRLTGRLGHRDEVVELSRRLCPAPGSPQEVSKLGGRESEEPEEAALIPDAHD